MNLSCNIIKELTVVLVLEIQRADLVAQARREEVDIDHGVALPADLEAVLLDLEGLGWKSLPAPVCTLA